MSTFAATVLKHRQKQDGTFHVYIRVTHQRQKAYIPTEYHVKKSQLNRKNEIIDNYIIQACNKIMDRYRNEITRLGYQIDSYSVADLVQYLNLNKNEFIDYIGIAKDHVKELRAAGRKKTAETYEGTINNLIAFTGLEILPINYIDLKFLKNFESWMTRKEIGKDKEGNAKIGMSYVTIAHNMRNVRVLHNVCKAKFNREDIGLILIPYNPFKAYKIPKQPETRKRNLGIRDIQCIRDSAWEKELDIQGRDVFMISFYLAGMNTIDIYNCPKPKQGRITYNRTKTKDRREDHAKFSIRIETELLPLLEKYKGKEKAFNFCEKYTNARDFNKYLNRGLNRIGKELGYEESLTTYFARHSWATIARNDCRISKDDVHLALNHSDPSMKITDVYIAKDWSIIDDANRKVLDLLKNTKAQKADQGL